MSYNNSVLTVTPTPTPDPFVTFAHGKFYLTFTAGDRVEVWCSNSVLDFHNASKHTIWRPPPGKEYSGGIWAPELHALNGRWYVYVACENPKEGNKSHRMYVLGGPSADSDPCQGQWDFLGPLRGVPPHQWAIDGTVAHLNGGLYFIYSGWPLDGHGDNDKVQELFIVRLLSPEEADGSRRPTRISKPDHPWEKSGPSGINEGPQYLAAPDGSWQGIAYSCAGSWTRDYKMNTIQFKGGDPLHESSWHKSNTPLIQEAKSDSSGAHGPGHGNFVPIGNETIAVFHATDKPTDGWGNRKARCQRVTWTRHGPDMGGCCGPVVQNVNIFMQQGGVGAATGGGAHHGGDHQKENESGLKKWIHKAEDKLREL